MRPAQSTARLARPVLAVLIWFGIIGLTVMTTDFESMALSAEQNLRRILPRLAHDKEKAALLTSVEVMKSEAARLSRERKDSGLPSTMELAELEGRLNQAKAETDALEQQAEQEWDYARTRMRQLELSQADICSQMGGNLTGTNCIFTCRSDQMQQCQQQQSVFDSRIAQLRAEAERLGAKAIQADDRAAQARSKLQSISEQFTMFSSKVRDFNKRSTAFTTGVELFYRALDKAERTPLPVKTGGPAWLQLLQQDDYLRSGRQNDNKFRYDCFSTRHCSDLSTEPNGNLVLPPPVNAAPSQSSATYQQAYAEAQDLVTEFNRQRAEVREAVANDTPDKAAKIAEWARTLSQVGGKTSTLRNRYRIDKIEVPSPATNGSVPKAP